MFQSFQIPYGHGTLPLTVPTKQLKAVLTPKGEESPQSLNLLTQQHLVEEALANPIDSLPLHILSQNKNKVLIITSDHTRPVPSAITMPILLSHLRKGNPHIQVRILIATGMHRPMTQDEITTRFGPAIAKQEEILNHISTQDEQMVFKGTLPSGGELWLNAQVDWADLIISEGFIEPHFFAGFSGGRKSVLPGIASHKTVLYNHNSVFIANPNAVQGNLHQNPLHLDMTYAAQKANLAFILNVRLGSQKQIISAYAGHPVNAHEKGCHDCLSHGEVKKAIGDIVITSNGGYPLDQNVYQAVKGMCGAAPCLAPGGVLIMAARCSNGHGGEEFYNWFAKAQSPKAVTEKILSIPPTATIADQWEAQKLAAILQQNSCIFVTDKENQSMVEAMHMTYAQTFDQALAIAHTMVAKNPQIVVVPNGVDVIIK